MEKNLNFSGFFLAVDCFLLEVKEDIFLFLDEVFLPILFIFASLFLPIVAATSGSCTSKVM